MRNRPLTVLRIFARDEDEPEIHIPIPHVEENFYSMESEQDVTLFGDYKLQVYAELSTNRDGLPDVSLSIIEGDKSIDVRCCGGVIVAYKTALNRDVLFQIGSGAWESDA